MTDEILMGLMGSNGQERMESPSQFSGPRRYAVWSPNRCWDDTDVVQELIQVNDPVGNLRAGGKSPN